MKIAILFGSFNPITNAHIAAMKSAVEHLNADKGFFVATNGQYLRKKSIKINDPFYLTEDERKSIIEQICENEPNLSFWGFEMGGVIPRRYQTLCKIQSQYPDAEIYEIQGADKVRSIGKVSKSEDYVSNIRFAVFARNGIDIEQVIDDDPVLSEHKSSFIMLPALDAGADISSTEVRRRFYEGIDYTDIIPAAAVEVLRKHQPSDFTISFADRIQTLMKDGRFGPNNARKLVYRENTSLFNAWKNSTASVELGDYQAFLDNTKLYKSPYDVTDLGTVYDHCETGCINADCIDVAEHLIAKGYNPAILNLASAKKAGGGYRDGKGAQEESLCFASTLSQSLYQYSDPKYVNIRESGVRFRELGYPLNLNWGGIYTPDVTFFRNNASKFYTLRDSNFRCDVITVAALSFNGRMDYAYANEMSYRSDTGGFTPEGEAIMLNKIRTIFRMGVEHGKDSLVLGAFGCGAYKLPVPEVVRLFRIVMNEPEFANKFRLLVFAILERSNKPSGLNGKFADFYHEFGTYTMN